MGHDAQWIFYKSIAVGLPRQKDFFEYNPTIYQDKNEALPLFVWGNNQFSSSYDDVFSDIEAYVLEIFVSVLRHVPYLEQGFLAGECTFGKSEGTIDVFIVTNTKRVRFVKCIMNGLLWFINFYLRKKSGRIIRMVGVVDRIWCDFGWMRGGVGDLMSAYWIGHLCCIYEQYHQGNQQFFSSNRRIKYTIPNHPLMSVIALGISRTQGSSAIRGWFEKLMGGGIGDVLEWILWSLGGVKKKDGFRYEKSMWISPWMGGEKQLSKRVLLKWKVTQKMRDS